MRLIVLPPPEIATSTNGSDAAPGAASASSRYPPVKIRSLPDGAISLDVSETVSATLSEAQSASRPNSANAKLLR